MSQDRQPVLPRPLTTLPAQSVFCCHGGSIPGSLPVAWEPGVGQVGGCPLSPSGKGRSGEWEVGGDDSPAETGVCPTVSRLGPHSGSELIPGPAHRDGSTRTPWGLCAPRPCSVTFVIMR